MSIVWQSTIAICAGLLSILPLQTATAQDYPTKPVRIISGFGAGSAGDVLIRLLVPKLSQSTGQQFIVEYKPGGGSNIAAEFVVRAPADGYTLFLGTSANTINATLSSNLSFDFAKDFAPIAQLGSVPNLLVVNPSLGVTSVRELIALAKAKPEQIGYATSGVGTLAHGRRAAQCPCRHQARARPLPERRAGGGRCAGRPRHGLVRAGEYRLAACRSRQAQGACHDGEQAHPMAPDVPTMAEAADLPRYESAIWYGLLAPARTPRDVVDKLSRLANEALQAKDTLAQMRAQGMASWAEVRRTSPGHRCRHQEVDRSHHRGRSQTITADTALGGTSSSCPEPPSIRICAHAQAADSQSL